VSIAAPALGRIWSIRAEEGGSWHTWVRIASLAAATAALGIAAWQGSWPSVLVGSLLFVGGWALTATIWGTRERDFAVTLYMGGMGLRLLVGAIAHVALAGNDGFLFLDDRAYDEASWRMVQAWQGVYKGIPKSDNYLLVNYTYLVSMLYYVIGHELLAAKWINALVGALTAVLTFALALRLTQPVGAKFAGLAMAVFPSLVFWSALNLKDTWVTFLIVAIIFGTLKFSQTLSIITAVLTIVAFHSLENMRLYAFFALGWLMPITFFIVSDAPRRKKLIYGLSFTIAVIGVMALVNNESFGLRMLSPKRLEAVGTNRVVVGERAETGLDFEKIPKGQNVYLYHLENLPKGVMYVLGAPFPWTARRIKDFATVPEMLAWYGVFVLALVGIVTAFRRHWRQLLMSLIFTAILIAMLGAVEGNAGTIYRHRAMLMPTTFVAAGIGVTWLLSQFAARRLNRTPQKAAS
jgi:hypothetical protein